MLSLDRFVILIFNFILMRRTALMYISLSRTVSLRYSDSVLKTTTKKLSAAGRLGRSSHDRHANLTSITGGNGADQTAWRSAPARSLSTSASASASAASFQSITWCRRTHLLLITVNYRACKLSTRSRPWNPTMLHRRPNFTQSRGRAVEQKHCVTPLCSISSML